MTEDGRRYSREEVEAIIAHAADLERVEESNAKDALTLAEIQKIAGEAGIDPQKIAIAARGLAKPVPASGGVLGAPLAHLVERTIPCAAGPEVLEELVPEINRTYGGGGRVSLIGSTLTWSSPNVPIPVELTVRVRDGAAVIQASARFGGAAGGLFGGIGGGVGGGLGAPLAAGIAALTGSGLLAAGAAVLVVGGSLGLARFLYRRAVARGIERTEKLADRIAELLTEKSKP